MQYINHHFIQMSYKAIVVLLISGLLVSCAYAPWESPRAKTEPVEKEVQEIEALIKKSPESTKLRQDLLKTKESVTQDLMLLAEKAKLAGDDASAKSYYERILSFDPNNQSALDGIDALTTSAKQTKQLANASELAQNNQLQLAKSLVHRVLLETPNNDKAKQLDASISEKIGKADSQPPKLKPSTDKPVTLELRDANIKVVFEALSRATSINFILDKDIKPDSKANVFVRNMGIEDAIDMVLSSNGLQKKTLSENSVLVFPNNPQKLKDYQDLMIRSFYLTNTSAKQAATMLKSMLKVKDIYIDERLNMVVIRDTPEVIRIAEKLIQANDIEDAEVVLDIEVLEVTKTRLQELGITYPTQLSVIGGANGLTLEALKNITDAQIGVTPNPALNFRKTTGDVNLLSNPRIRVKNNEKANILVGDKVPIITTTTANLVTSESVTYIDVGLKLNVEPRITLDDFVNIKVGLEVSSLGDRTTTSQGATVYTIGTREANTILRLKNGETQILAGLISDDERKNASKLPGFGDIPLIGRLFSNQDNRKTKTEIVLAITPRIVGQLRLPEADVSEYWSGTEDFITDKPSIVIPATNNGSALTSPRARSLERLREQRQRQIEQNVNDLGSIPGETTTNEAPATPAPLPSSSLSNETNQTNESVPKPSNPLNIQVDPSKPVRF